MIRPASKDLEVGLELDSDSSVRVVLAGQLPPPIGGQNLMVQLILRLLSEDRRLKISHWKFRFTREWSEGRRLGLWKLIELAIVLCRLFKLRLRGPIDIVLYPAGGPHTVPILRDVILLPIAALVSKRVSLLFHAAGVAKALENMPAPLRAFCRWVFHKSISDAVVLTNFGRNDAESLGINTIRIIPNAIEDRCPGGPPERSSHLGPVTLLSVGHICSDKGTPELLRAFAEISADFPDARLRIVGECLPPFSDDKLASLVNELGIVEQVELCGIRQGKELDAVFADADIFIFPTQAPYESFGLVMVEAMMWGLPVVLTDWRANSEVFGKHSGGICFEIGESLENSLTQALGSALEQRESWKEWGRINRHCFERHYTIPVFRENMSNLILKN